MKKKVMSVLLCLGLTVSMAAVPAAADETGGIARDEIKVGFVYVGDDTDQGYTSNFMDGTKELKGRTGS